MAQVFTGRVITQRKGAAGKGHDLTLNNSERYRLYHKLKWTLVLLPRSIPTFNGKAPTFLWQDDKKAFPSTNNQERRQPDDQIIPKY